MRRNMVLIFIAVLAAVAVLVIVLFAVTGGVSGRTSNEATANEELEKRADSMETVVQDLLGVIHQSGLAPIKANGRIEESGGLERTRYCLQYRASIAVATSAGDAADFAALEKQLLESGWESADVVMSKDPEHPGARFQRDGLELDVLTGGFTSGGTSYGADEISMSVKQTNDDCVFVPDFDRVREAQETFARQFFPGQ